MRLGPDEWWCWTPADTVGAERVPELAGRDVYALIDLSDAQQAFEIRGAVYDGLSQGCELDFERLPPDFASRTRCAAFSVVICPQGEACYLWTETSLARSLGQWLDQAGRLTG
jgi:sarcosine oxidase gamma subunit